MTHRLLALCLVVLLAGGCASVKIHDPLAKVVAVKVVAQTDEGARVEITLALDNYNDIPLPLKETDYSVTVHGGGTYTATDVPDRTLPASGHQLVVIAAAFATHESLVGAEYTVHGSVHYEPPGEIRKLLTESFIPLPGADFQSKGQLE